MNCDANTFLIPYNRYTLTNDQKHTCLGPQPIISVEETMYGPWTVASSPHGDGDLGVSLPQRLGPGLYLFAKIDTFSSMFVGRGRRVPNYASTDDISLSSKFNQNDTERVRDNAVNLVRQVIERPGLQGMDPDIKKIVQMAQRWPIRLHDHLTIG